MQLSPVSSTLTKKIYELVHIQQKQINNVYISALHRGDFLELVENFGHSERSWLEQFGLPTARVLRHDAQISGGFKLLEHLLVAAP